MYDRPAAVALRNSLHALAASWPSILDAKQRDSIRTQVCALVDELRSLGFPPERVIIAVKALGEEAGLRPARMVSWRGGPLTVQDELLTEMVGWCIEQYFRETTADSSTS